MLHTLNSPRTPPSHPPPTPPLFPIARPLTPIKIQISQTQFTNSSTAEVARDLCYTREFERMICIAEIAVNTVGC